MSVKSKLINKATTIVENSNDAKELALASAIVKNVNEAESLIDESIYYNGQPGEIGFGVCALRDYEMKPGYTKADGHENPLSANYGKVYDITGSHMFAIRVHYFKIENNKIYFSDSYKPGYVLPRMFIDGGEVASYVLVDAFGCGNVNGVFASVPGIDPCSTHVDHNPISNLKNSPANTFGGLYKAVKTRSDEHALLTDFAWSHLYLMAKAHGEASTTTMQCAYIDVLPKMPKGNLNNALSDVNDPSVTFTPSGYSNCALTGSGVPFAKTTHNGQDCGIADLNGNMWEVASGFIRTDLDGFLILKESVSIADIVDDSTGANGAYNVALYDPVDLSDIVNSNAAWTYLGNGANQVFAMNTDRNSNDYKRTALGIPKATGVSGSGTTEFGNDGLYRYLRNEMAALRGGDWGYSSYAGLGCVTLNAIRTGSNGVVGGRAYVVVK